MTSKLCKSGLGSLAARLAVTLSLIAGTCSLCSASPAIATETGPPEAPLTEPCKGPILNGDSQRLCGTLNPHTRARTGYYFAYNERAPCTAGARTAPQEVEGEEVGVFGEVSALEPDTSYTACLVAVNAGGEAVGNEVSFVTPSAPPLLVDLSTGAITQHDAVLEVEINPQGLATTYEFRLESPLCQPTLPEHCEASGGNQIATGSIPAGHGQDKVSVDIAEIYNPLTPNTTYGYSVLAANSAGETVSTQQSFTTPAEPITTPSPGVPPSTQSSLTLATQAPQQTAAASPPQGPSVAVLGPLTVPTEKRGTPQQTRAKKLSMALRACERASRKIRAQCRREAQKKYGQSLSTHRRGRPEEFTFER
jgi:hypothetical protein